MAAYDSSVIIKCLKGDNFACNVILSDDNCVITPTAWEEVNYKVRPWAKEKLEKIENHCNIYTYNDYPFKDREDDINYFVNEIRLNWYHGKPKRGRGAAKFNRDLRYFKRSCIGSKNPAHLYNDYQIYKEANVLAEEGISDILVSADHSQTDPKCQEIYGEIMESLPPPYTEERKVNCVFYKSST